MGVPRTELTNEPPDASASAALTAGRWPQARAGFEAALAERETPDARLGLAMALWWLGENRASIDEYTRAYALYSQRGDVALAAQCAVWLAITYKGDFGNHAAANGWAGRADRLLEGLETGPAHAWVWVARAYRMEDLDRAAELTERAFAVARAAGDVDLELVALSQSGLIAVGRGRVEAGLAMIDEALAAALAGERSSLNTVAYACCDMLSACELAGDVTRAGQWCRVADGFVERYGCPFLYAECRIYYGSLLTGQGKWGAAERALETGVRITADVSPGLHAMALVRLADLRTRQGRLEEAGHLLAEVEGSGLEEVQASLCRAAWLLAGGEARAVPAQIGWRLRRFATHPVHLASALDLLTSAALDVGDNGAAARWADRLADLAATSGSDAVHALARSATGRVLLGRGECPAAAAALEAAAAMWSGLDRPLESARCREAWAKTLAGSTPEGATEQARRTWTAYEELGASLDADRVAAWLRSVGVRTPAGPRGTGALTTREREVWALLAAGLSNPQIAERLHLSRKTVAHHVSNILGKLALRNRAEAAAAHAVAASGSPGPGPTDRRRAAK